MVLSRSRGLHKWVLAAQPVDDLDAPLTIAVQPAFRLERHHDGIELPAEKPDEKVA